MEKEGDAPRARLAAALKRAAALLPGQRPIEAFVHHNTLHAFEDEPFEDAVRAAGRIYGAAPFMSEDVFREAYAAGRILERDLDAVLALRVPEQDAPPPARGSLRALVKSLMLTPQSCGSATGGPGLRWRLAETPALERLPEGLPRTSREALLAAGPTPRVLGELWRRCQALASPAPRTPPPFCRLREAVLARSGVDIDAQVKPFLITWAGAYLDNGYAYWPMSDRGGGFFRALLIHLSGGAAPRAWCRGLDEDARRLLAADVSAEAFALQALAEIGAVGERLESAVVMTLLDLPGWAGMFVQLAARPDLAPGAAPPTELVDFLAARLLIERAAARAALGLDSLPAEPRLLTGAPPAEADDPLAGAWALFQSCLAIGLTPDRIPDGAALTALKAVLETWGSEPRRALWQLAYERRYRVEVFDSLLAHQAFLAERAAPKGPRCQVVCCIDDREESLRRHLEELNPEYETFGVAGYFGVAVYFRGLGQPHARPLCPAGLIPRHRLAERVGAESEESWSGVAARLKAMARAIEAGSVASLTLMRGGLASLAGWSALLPFATRLLAPRRHARLTSGPRAATALDLERRPEDDEPEAALLDGFSVSEMVDIVQHTLEDMGLTKAFAPLVCFLGHGSSSLNNPHEAAHDCGACGGGRGGPNARAFAAMANRPDVREALKTRGLTIPEDTFFLGGYHNTCDDAIEFYGLAELPQSHRARFEALAADLEEARRRDAHERCRRFLSAPLELDGEGALAHVENRAEDIAQPRPEYGHATNALCLVGRRAWSRGAFLDRRVFLTSYDSGLDPDGAILSRLLASVGPVGAGINLEYYFSFVDPSRYGSSTKLPHNITGFLGVMDGASSDLRTGLPWQMVEIHEPVRLLNIIEARPERLTAILDERPELKRLVVNRWILVAAFDPEERALWFFGEDGFERYRPERTEARRAPDSLTWYRGRRDHLPVASIAAGLPLAGREGAA